MQLVSILDFSITFMFFHGSHLHSYLYRFGIMDNCAHKKFIPRLHPKDIKFTPKIPLVG